MSAVSKKGIVKKVATESLISETQVIRKHGFHGYGN
jgi:hypothetical protein